VPAFIHLCCPAPAGNKELNGWFYHRALLKDVDGDGLVDVVAARATKPLVGKEGGELVWMRQPPGGDPLAPASLPWAEAPLYNGTFSPDVFFRLTALRPGNETDEQVV
jgi:hypothetical protein